MLRWSSVQLMSIGRVCTCGHTRAPAAHSRSTAAITLSHASGTALLWKIGESVVGMPCSRDSLPSISTRDTVRPGVEELVDDLEHATALTEHRAQRFELGVLGPAARHGVEVLLDVDVARRHADRARVEALAQQVAHRRDLFRGRGPAHVLAEHREAQHGVTDERGEVEREVALQRVDHPAERLTPAPVDALGERRLGHLLDEPEHAREPLAQRRGHGSEAQRAVASDDRCDAVLDRRIRVRVEAELRVVVRVRIDEARRHDLAGRVDDPRRVGERAADRHDAAALDADVAEIGRQPGAVDHLAAADDYVEHQSSPIVDRDRTARSTVGLRGLRDDRAPQRRARGPWLPR